MKYPVRLTPAPEGGFVVTFRDVPEAISQGDTLEEARTAAVDALVTAMDFYFEDHRPAPLPSKARAGEEIVPLPTSVAAKVLLLNAMIEEKVRPSDLARRLGTSPQEVNRLIDLHHTTKIDRIAEALEALGKHLEVSVA